MNPPEKIELKSRVNAKQFTIRNLKIEQAKYKAEKAKLTLELRKLRERRDHAMERLQEEINRSNNLNIKRVKRKKKAKELKEFKAQIQNKRASIDVVDKNLARNKVNMRMEQKDLNLLKGALASLT